MSTRLNGVLVSLLAHLLAGFILLRVLESPEPVEEAQEAELRFESFQLVSAARAEPVMERSEPVPPPEPRLPTEAPEAPPAQPVAQAVTPPVAAPPPVVPQRSAAVSKPAAPTPRPEPKRKPPTVPASVPQTEAPLPAPPPALAPVEPAAAAPAAAPAVSEVQPPVDLKSLLRAIEAHKRYPARARRLGVQGQVRVLFELLADGQIVNVRIGHSSGSALLDEAATAAVAAVGRFRCDETAAGPRALAVVIRFRLD